MSYDLAVTGAMKYFYVLAHQFSIYRLELIIMQVGFENDVKKLVLPFKPQQGVTDSALLPSA